MIEVVDVFVIGWVLVWVEDGDVVVVVCEIFDEVV